MEKPGLFLAVLLTTLLHQSVCRISDSPLKVFYVKPTVPRTECPSGDSPCHSLQYYANHSNFTSNSRFLFLEGEHHLDSVVNISNVANLSLVGASPGVEILCNPSVDTGFAFQEFSRINVENLALANCSGNDDIAVSLKTGSELNISRFMISSSYAMAITATNVVGLFSVTNSTFLAPTGDFRIDYSSCDRPSYFRFRNSSMVGGQTLMFVIVCVDVEIQIIDSIFASRYGLTIAFVEKRCDERASFFLVSNTIFRASIIDMNDLCHGNYSCNSVNFTGDTFINSALLYEASNNCGIIIEDSAMLFKTTEDPFVQLYNGYLSINDAAVYVIFRNVTFASNRVSGPLVLSHNGTLLFVDCSFKNNTQSQSVLQMFDSKLTFEGRNIFYNNSALIGGALQLLGSSIMHLRPNTHILFEKNHADYVGGAIYIDNKYIYDPCFFQVDFLTFDNNTKIYFLDNTANISGSSLYIHGGGGYLCRHFFDIFEISNTEADPSAIASDPPDKVCLCEEGKRQPDCSHDNYSTNAFPGQEFPIYLAVVGSSFNGVVHGGIRAFSIIPHGALGGSQLSQASSKSYCENFYYSMETTEKKVTFLLAIEQSLLDGLSGLDNWNWNIPSLNITVHLLDCPLGFSLSPANGTCACDPMLDGSGVECNINNQSFLRPTSSWIGFIDESPSNMTGVMFHPNCPIGYCSNEVSITSNTSDSQCQPHRTGLLCGECEEGYSLTLGDGKCAKCSNTYLLLVLLCQCHSIEPQCTVYRTRELPLPICGVAEP